MLWTFCVIAFVFIQVVSPEDIPEECKKPPPFIEKPQDCCKMPQVFTDEELEECGLPKRDSPPPQHPPPGGPGGRPPFPPDCGKHNCLLKKKDLLKDDETLDKEGLVKFLDKNKEDHPDMEKAIDAAKERCLSEKALKFGPPEICDNVKIMFCISTTMFMECPSWSDSEKCSGLKDYLDKCKASFKH